MGKLQFNPNDALNCMYAYWYMIKHGDDAIEASDQAVDLTIEKEFFKLEDDTYPELIEIIFDQKQTHVFWYLLEGLNLAEFDPTTPGGKMLWEHLFNSEHLTKKALEEGQAVGKWDTLRQVINMGQIAYMTKVNAALAYLKKCMTEERETHVAEVLNMEYVKAAREILSREEVPAAE